MRKFHLILLLFGLSIHLALYSQTATVTGVVSSSEDKQPIPGATVLVKNTTIGTSTDLDGKFRLENISTGTTLVFSYVGMKSEEIVFTGTSILNIELQPILTRLDEVVVIGYGVQKKSVNTGAITKVEIKEIEKSGGKRIEQVLQGRVPGVIVTSNSGQPGASAEVIIRGTSSINSGTQPLYIVDGMAIEGGIDYINPSDIESVEVLKDAASAAIYGTRAANGVIIISTRSGKAGGKSTLSMSYDSYFGFQNPWKKLDLLNAREYAVLMNEASINSGEPIPFANPQLFGTGTDWQEEVFNYHAPVQNHSVNIIGGNDKSGYYASIAYLEQDGIVAKGNSEYSRLNVRFNSDHNVSDRFKFGNKIGYARTFSRGVAENTEWGSPLSRALNMDPITPLIITDPEEAALYAQNYPNAVMDANGNYYGISQHVTSEILNPVAALSILNQKGYADKIVSSIYGEFDIIKDLKFRSEFGSDLAYWGNDASTPKYYLNATNKADYDIANRGYYKGLTWSWENTLSYSRQFNNNHNLSMLAGTSALKSVGDGMGGSKQGFPFYDPNMNYFNYLQDKESEQLFGYGWQSALASIFARAIYSFDDKYLFTAILRRDGSSNFGSNNRYAIFPSVSVGWVISKENFLAGSDVISFLKLRASWGRNGNEKIESFAYTSIMASNWYTFGQGEILTTGSVPARISNPDLRWETVQMLDIGLDLGLYKDRFLLTMDYFNKTTYDLLVAAPIPELVGNGSPITNLGDMRNRGLEVDIRYRDQFNGIRYNTGINFSYLTNKVIKIGNEAGYITGQKWGPQGLEITRITEGEPIHHFFGYLTDGLFQNQDEVNAYVNAEGKPLQPNAEPGDVRFKDLNGDGIINDKDRTVIGSPIPDLTMGFNLSAEYRNFDMNLFVQGVFGRQIYNASHRYDLPIANRTADQIERWHGEGTSNSIPRLTIQDLNGNSTSSDLYIENGDYIRLKNIQLGYTLKKTAAGWLPLSSVRFYLSALNLLTLTSYSGFDPEIVGGVDRGIYPQPRTILIGANVKF